MIRRLAIPVALALTVGACATYDSGYYGRSSRDGYYSSDGYYRGSGYDGGNYGAYNGDGYYSPGSDGYGDYYYDRPQVIYDQHYSPYGYYGYGNPYGYGYGSYGFGYGLSYFPNNWFGIQFGSSYSGYPYGYYNPWYSGYSYGHHRHRDHDDDRDDRDARGAGPPRNHDARREAERLVDQGGLSGMPVRSTGNPRDLRSGIPVGGSGYYGGGLPRDRADYGGTPTPPTSDRGERLESGSGSANTWRQGWRRPPMPRDQADDRQPIRLGDDGAARAESMRLAPGMPGVVPLAQMQPQPMPRADRQDYQPPRQQMERAEPRRAELRREEREAPSREDSPRRNRDADGGDPER